MTPYLLLILSLKYYWKKQQREKHLAC